MKRSFALLLLAALLLTACGQPATYEEAIVTEQPMTWQEQYDLGLRYLSDGNYQEAILAFTAAIEIDPRQAEAFVGRGDAYLSLGRASENLQPALSDYETALEMKADVTEKLIGAYIDFSDLYLNNEQYDDSIAMLNTALALNDTRAEIYEKLADVYLAMGDMERAIEVLQRGTEMTDDDGLRAMLEQEQGKGVAELPLFETGEDEYGNTYERTYDELHRLIKENNTWSGEIGSGIFTNKTTTVYQYSEGGANVTILFSATGVDSGEGYSSGGSATYEYMMASQENNVYLDTEEAYGPDFFEITYYEITEYTSDGTIVTQERHGESHEQ